MTRAQRNNLLINLWPSACRAQGWKISDRTLRLRVFSIALSHEIQSQQHARALIASSEQPSVIVHTTNQIDHDREFTRVKNLLLMLSDSVTGAREVGAPEINKARQKQKLILDMILCLAIYPVDQPMGIAGAEAYVSAVMRGKFKKTALEDLSIKPVSFIDRQSGLRRHIPSQLDQLLITLTDRLHHQPRPGSRKQPGYRIAAGHTHHQMRRLAGLSCDPSCTECPSL